MRRLGPLVMLIGCVSVCTAEPARLAAFAAAWNAHDREALLQSLTPDAVLTVVLDRAEYGRPAVLADEIYSGAHSIGDWAATTLPGSDLKLHDCESGERGTRCQAELSGPTWRALGIAEAGFTFEATMRLDRLQSVRWLPDAQTSAKLVAAIPAANKLVVRQFLERLNAGDASGLAALLGPGLAFHGAALGSHPEARDFDRANQQLRAAFPDLAFTTEDLIGEGDRVAVRLVGRGTNRGGYLSAHPSARPATIREQAQFRLKNQKVVELWTVIDRLEVLEQLEPESTTPSLTLTNGYQGFR